MTEQARKLEFEGIVTSDKMDKTVVVTVERLEKHPVFGKYVRRRAKFKAHDERNECRPGDRVLIRECRPISREKCWRVVKILERQE
ncbi:MAG TPA: 30S ribosomal protein S17 [Deltaproteobacteria bacterium]|nr:30S ribosomal protein S17 [Deltaproteobacteria bacterium]HOM29601.1 30S ribosomal protein S17 [Deltaproteobacteria bacterium]HPP81289.1 30S ribosomal protein S17 [Deltaproteobacteria bacterium]